MFTNGATEDFYLIAQLYARKRVEIVAPTFSEYEDSCDIFNVEYRLISRTEIIATKADVIFICNPNNPDGTIFSKGELETFFKAKPNTTFVIDEAYIEFTNKAESVSTLIDTYTNLIIVRSLTKTFAIPGLRLGYVIANQNTVNKFLNIKIPWSVNLLAIKAGEFIFKNYEDFQFNVSNLIEETRIFKEQLKVLNGFKVLESSTSYFLVELLHKTAKELKEYLITKHYILVRDATNFKNLKGEYIRLSTQNKKANQALVTALKKWI